MVRSEQGSDSKPFRNCMWAHPIVNEKPEEWHYLIFILWRSLWLLWGRMDLRGGWKENGWEQLVYWCSTKEDGSLDKNIEMGWFKSYFGSSINWTRQNIFFSKHQNLVSHKCSCIFHISKLCHCAYLQLSAGFLWPKSLRWTAYRPEGRGFTPLGVVVRMM